MHFQELYSLSQEYIIDDMAQKIRKEIYLQSQLIQSIDHAFDLLETLEIMKQSNGMAKNNCMEYMIKHLKSWKVFNDAVESRSNISFILQMELRGILLGNLLRRMRPKELSEDQDVKADAFNIAAYLRHFGTTTEALNSFT